MSRRPLGILEERLSVVKSAVRLMPTLGESAVIEMLIDKLGGMTHEEIGVVFGCSKQAVSDVEQRAKRKCGADFQERGITSSADVVFGVPSWRWKYGNS